MPALRIRHLRVVSLILVAAITGGMAHPLRSAEPEVVNMAPFEVEEEFGVDGLRIQNSQSVLNAHLLEAHGIGQLQDVSGVAPNLFTSNSDSRGFGDVITLRGAANSIFFSPPAVALYVDDVPGGSVSSYPSSLVNVESFVVKSGPQGTEYGRNAPAGIIEIRTREPGRKHRGTLQFDYGSFDATSVRAGFDGPLSHAFAYSASIGYAARDGYIDNAFQGRTADDREAIHGRVALYWRPSDGLQLRLGAFVEEVDDDAARLSSLASPDPYVVSSDLNGTTQMERRQFSFQLRRQFPWGTLVATTSHQDWDLDPAATDLDLTGLPLAFSEVVQNERTWTQEFRLESNPGSSPLQWRAGLFYFDSGIEGDALREFIVPPGPFVPPGFVQTERTLFDLGQTNLAAYGSGDYALTDETNLEFGIRLEQTESDLDRTKESSNNFGFPTPPEPAIDAAQDDTHVSASAGVVHAISDSLSVRVRTSLARKPAGFSAFTGDLQHARFDDERFWSSEAGITFSPPQSRFGGSVLAFWSDIDGYQFERTVPNSTDYVVVNADSATARGLEAKFMWNPIDRVWWDFQAGYTEAKFDRHTDAAGNNVSGNRVPFVPRFTVRTGVTIDLGNGLSGSASYAGVGRSYFDEQNTAAVAQASYGIVNARLAYRTGRWSVTIYGHNLFDQHYYQFINLEIFAGSPGAPRRFGVLLSYVY